MGVISLIRIKNVKAGYEIEPLKTPLGFKGGYLTGLWQTIALMEGESGKKGVGIGVQSVLWSDPEVFSSFDEKAGNEVMFNITRYALNLAKDIPFETPVDLLDRLLPLAYEYGKKLTNRPALRLTFILNSLVAVDNAAWMLYCSENGISGFDGMIPGYVRTALPCRNSSLASIPLISYGVSGDEIERIIDSGYFFLKIKIGSDPMKDGDRLKMLEWDKKRLTEIHDRVKDRVTPYTKDSHIPYYFDANGRYDSKDTLLRFLDHADKIGALNRIMLLEEPFPEEYREDVHDIPVRLAADESAHSDTDVLELIDRGYRAIALKPAAKTMSMSFKIAKAAYEKGIPGFCADLTVNPVLVDWNKNVAARLQPLPGMEIGLLESNGPQNYANWERMKTYHPNSKAGWIETRDGIFAIDSGFYEKSGGIFNPPLHYVSLLKETYGDLI